MGDYKLETGCLLVLAFLALVWAAFFVAGGFLIYDWKVFVP